MKKTVARVGTRLRPVVGPCAHCGSPGKVWHIGFLYSVECTSLRCGIKTPWKRTRKTVLKLWNQRANAGLDRQKEAK